jgi:hypothetical protein
MDQGWSWSASTAPSSTSNTTRFQVGLDGQPPGPADARTVEIRFLDPGVQAYAFTFG